MTIARSRVCLMVVAVVGLGPSGLATGEECYVCGEELGEGAPVATVEYRGRERRIHKAELAAWERAKAKGTLDALVQHHEPRAALFQGDSQFLNPSYRRERQAVWFWLIAGFVLSVAVGSGAAAAGLALVRRRAAGCAFVLGFALPLVGIPLSLCLPCREGQWDCRGTKVPHTRAPMDCPECGQGNHPAATRCSHCGATLNPTAESEVNKASGG